MGMEKALQEDGELDRKRHDLEMFSFTDDIAYL